ncbi:rifampicin phosphotransferase-like [Asterias amurensis]|uniref:rifampicin phosphotransferase-like n=1 Tax=Asterias amurensis TaxID=7602 RepID=UPI003AB2E2DC
MEAISLVLWIILFPSVVCMIVFLFTRPQTAKGRWFYLRYLYMRWLVFLARRNSLTLGRRSRNCRLMMVKAKEMMLLESSKLDSENYKSLYINGSDVNGDHRVVVRLTSLPGNHQQSEVCFLLRVRGIGDLVLPGHPSCHFDIAEGDGFAAAGLKCTVVEPLRIWRISYNGMCRVGVRDTSDEQVDERPLVHVRCTLLWSAFTSYFDFTTDVHPHLAAENLATNPSSKNDLIGRINSNSSHHYEQFGMIHGTVQVGGNEETTLLLRGVKTLSGGPGSDQWDESIQCYVINYIVQEDGKCLHVGAYYDGKSVSFSGFMTNPNGFIHPVRSVYLPVCQLMGNYNELPKTFSFSVRFENDSTLEIQTKVDKRAYFNLGTDQSMRVCEAMSSYRVNGVQARGFCRTMFRSDNARPKSHPIQERCQLCKEPAELCGADREALVLPLGASSCRVGSMTGGKGSQLAMLIELKKHRQVEFEVPNGFCITTKAFNQHMEENEDLRTAIKTLSEVSCGIQNGDLKSACENTVALISKTEISDDMKIVISRQFHELFTENKDGQSFAIRSSAVGEDTPLMSAAGQMETYLCINTLEKIFTAVQKCWASQFSFQAVQYRRQYGQTVESSMAVVVQEIVPAETAGVVFSRDPITGNPSRVVINANFGLGESVVAGVSEADTIALEVDSMNNLTVAEKTIGRKEEAIFVAEEGGTKVTSLSSTESAGCALSDDTCLKLGRIALMLDDCFGDGRDIEYAVVGETVYLLQARAITTFDVPSQYELLHEFDTGIPSDRLFITTANIQEMCPGSTTPLTLSNFFWDCDASFQVDQLVLGKPLILPNVKTLFSFVNQAFLNLTDMVDFSKRASLFSPHEMGKTLLGEDLNIQDIDECDRIVTDHSRLSKWTWHLNTLKYCWTLWSSSEQLERMGNDTRYHLNKLWPTAIEQNNYITDMAADMGQMWSCHFKESTKGTISRRFVQEILKSANKDVNVDGEAAMLLSSCPGVESADVPLAIERVARAVEQEGMGVAFRDMSPEDALQWLRSKSSGSAGRAFEEFLKTHGHRCVKEIELREKSWGMDPIKTVPALQALLASGSLVNSFANKRYLGTEEAVARLKFPLSRIARLLMVKLILPKARRDVARRERSKSVTIKATYYRKVAYWRLAKLMVKEGRLPDEDLLFFFTPTEIGQLLNDRSPTLVARALRRRRILPVQDAHRFPLLFHGIPKPIEEDADPDETEMQLRGFPISPGVVKGTARVVTCLPDASSIKQGDILITRITDIGWSPYFPLIKGLVTEIGGLMSHGAVVAREYGLPCLVNVQRATTVFHSGDTVLLNGANGTIDKLLTN